MSSAITAKEAREKTQAKVVERRAFELKNAYDKIREAVNAGRYRADYIASNDEIGDYIFNHLVVDDYYVEMQVITDGALGLSISWEDSSYDPDKRYILPLEDTKHVMGSSLYAFYCAGHWCVGQALNDEAAISYGDVVTAKDLEGAPDWVKAIEPVEVD